jgi:predicted phage terminase large subunit-like protein
LTRRINAAAEEWSPVRVLVEDKASGQSVVQTLKAETGLPVVPVRAEGSKVSRAESVTGLFEAGKVLLPHNEPSWLEPWTQEHLRFGSGGRHDDQVDTTAHALRHLRERARNTGGGVAGVIVHGPREERADDPDERRARRAREMEADREEARMQQPNLDLPWGHPHAFD